MNNKQTITHNAHVGWGSTRVTYRRFGNFLWSSAPDYCPAFVKNGRRLTARLWWVPGLRALWKEQAEKHSRMYDRIILK